MGPTTSVVKDVRTTSLEASAVGVASDIGIDGRDVAGVLAFLEPLAVHDMSTYEHSLRVGVLAAKVALAASGLGDKLSQPGLALTGGLMHDIGKLSVPATVLSAYRLGPLEWAFVHRHPVAGYERLFHAGYYEEAIVAGLHHSFQEHPYGLSPNDIADASLVRTAKMVAFCDFFDAVMTRRDARHSLAGRSDPVGLLSQAYPGRSDWAATVLREMSLVVERGA